MAFSSPSPDARAAVPPVRPAVRPGTVAVLVALVATPLVLVLVAVTVWFVALRGGVGDPDGAIGDTVRDRKVQFTVTGVEDGPAEIRGQRPFESMTIRPQGRFVIVNYTAGNVGTGSAVVLGDEQLLYDDRGREFEPVAYLPYAGGRLFLSTVKSGNERRDSLVYDLPEGSEPAVIRLSEGALGRDGVYISLR